MTPTRPGQKSLCGRKLQKTKSYSGDPLGSGAENGRALKEKEEERRDKGREGGRKGDKELFK